MKLYLITQDEAHGWDTFDSAVVIAESEEAARATHPYGDIFPDWPKSFNPYWASDPKNVAVRYLGEFTGEPLDDGVNVVCASFNAG